MASKGNTANVKRTRPDRDENHLVFVGGCWRFVKEWATADEIRRFVASVSQDFLARFAASNPRDIWKTSDASNSRLLFRVEAIRNAASKAAASMAAAKNEVR